MTAALLGVLLAAVIGFPTLLAGAMYNAHLQRKENRRISRERVLERARGLLVLVDSLVADCLRLVWKLHEMEKVRSVTASDDDWIKGRGLHLVRATRDALMSRYEDFGVLPYEISTDLSHALLAATALKGTIESLVEAKKSLATSEWYAYEQPARESAKSLIKLKYGVADYVGVSIADRAKQLDLLRRMEAYKSSWIPD